MPLKSAQKAKVRKAISHYCEVAEINRLRRAYSQHRQILGMGLDPEDRQMDDCSGFDAKAFFWAMHETGIWLPDPLNMRWSGWGYTGTQYEYLKGHPAPVDKYLIGDMAIFGVPWNTVHTSICRKAGTAATAIFTSHGHQNWIFNQDAPEPISLTHEKAVQYLVGVYRHPSLI